MSKRHDSLKERLLLRQRLRQQLWLSTLALTVIFVRPFGNDGSGFHSSVSATPLPRSSVSTNQVTARVLSSERISPPPVDAVLANVRFKPGSQPKAKKTVVPAARSSRTLVTNRRDESNRSLRGISHLIDTQRSPNVNVSPVNRLIDR
jgi:hypothetical protein